MRRVIQRLLQSFYLRFFDAPTFEPITDKERTRMYQWLEMSYGHPGFEVYTQKFRGRKIALGILSGIGGLPHKQDDYNRYMAQQFELERLKLYAEKAHQKKEKDIAQGTRGQ